MLTFSDIFKSSFLENIASVSVFDMCLALLLAFGLGMFIFLVYKKTFSGVLYAASFGVTLVALTMITTLVILAVTSNVVLSLGMVGALSIVRFRAAIKEPLDIAFLYGPLHPGAPLRRGERVGLSDPQRPVLCREEQERPARRRGAAAGGAAAVLLAGLAMARGFPRRRHG